MNRFLDGYYLLVCMYLVLDNLNSFFRAMDQFPFPAPFPVWHPVYMVSMFTNLVTIPMAAHLLDPTTIQMALSTVLQPTAKEKDMRVRFITNSSDSFNHVLRTPREEKAFTEQPKIHS